MKQFLFSPAADKATPTAYNTEVQRLLEDLGFTVRFRTSPVGGEEFDVRGGDNRCRLHIGKEGTDVCVWNPANDEEYLNTCLWNGVDRLKLVHEAVIECTGGNAHLRRMAQERAKRNEDSEFDF